MTLKQYVRYEMRFDGRFSEFSVAFMGLSLFLRVFYYFGIVNLMDVNVGELFFSMILPILLCGAYLVLFRFMKWNAPGIYAIFGCAFCFLFMIWNFSSGDFLRIILSIFVYAIAGVLLLAAAGGYLPDKLPAAVAFAVILIFRFLLYSMRQSGFAGYISEFSSICLLASMLTLTYCFKPHVRSGEINRT